MKSGPPYGYTLLKVHKITKEEIAAKKLPPCRFVTDLSNGLSARSDKFIVWRWLSDLARDYAVDLVKDSTDALIKLEGLSTSAVNRDNNNWLFNMDVVALYDSLNHELVGKALMDAMDCCRPDWDCDFRKWLLDLVMLSFRSAVILFDEDWFVAINGIPTGGIPSVDAGNISVFYVLKALVYEPAVKRPELDLLIRFVDDGTGIWNGSKDDFILWFENIRTLSVSQYGLDFTYEINLINVFTQFLDIQYKFEMGVLATDIYSKPTDAHRYLEFTSCHPRHVFSSVIYSQAIRYRRIINDDDVFVNRLEELKSYFVRSSYPVKLISEIIDKVKLLPRSLEYKTKDTIDTAMTPWLTTYGLGFSEAKEQAVKSNKVLCNSNTWKNEETKNIPRLKVIAKRGPNLKDILFKRRAIAMDTGGSSIAVPCTDPNQTKRGAKCQCCTILSGKGNVTNNNKTVKTKGGNCKSCNIIYSATCKLCDTNNVYVGKTTNPLRIRVNGHRSNFYDLARKYKGHSSVINMGEIDDEKILGAHLVNDHNKFDKNDFNDTYNFDILAFCRSQDLRIREQSFIETLKTLTPFGLNQANSITGG